MAKSSLDGSKALLVRVGRVESVDLYEIKDSELDILEKGGPAELQLNAGLVLLTTAFSVGMTFASATFTNPKIETLYIVVGVVSALLGAYLMLAWYRTRRELMTLCARIRLRIPPTVVNAAVEDEQEVADGLVEDPDPPKG